MNISNEKEIIYSDDEYDNLNDDEYLNNLIKKYGFIEPEIEFAYMVKHKKQEEEQRKKFKETLSEIILKRNKKILYY